MIREDFPDVKDWPEFCRLVELYENLHGQLKKDVRASFQKTKEEERMAIYAVRRPFTLMSREEHLMQAMTAHGVDYSPPPVMNGQEEYDEIMLGQEIMATLEDHNEQA